MLKILDHRRAPIGSTKQCWSDQGNYVIREALHDMVGTSPGFGGGISLALRVLINNTETVY